jgi:hypothetical protein
MSDKPQFHELSVPPDAVEKGGHEVLRASVVEGEVSIALRRSFDDPFTWGVLFSDLARHAARVYALETGIDEAEALAQIRAGFAADVDPPTDDSGSTPSLN